MNTLYTTIQAAQYLGLKVRTLKVWRRLKKGPPFVRIGTRVRYELEALCTWIQNGQNESTAPTPEHEHTKAALVHALAVLSKLQEGAGNPTMPLQQVRMFLHVALHGEVPQASLEEVTGVEQSSVSRNVALLGPGLSPAEPGYGLIESFPDPWNRKRNLVRLTGKGETLAWEVQQAPLQAAGK